MSTNSSVTSRESEDLQAPTAAKKIECNSCKRRFMTGRGFTRHQRSCTAKSPQHDHPNSSELEWEALNE